MSTPANIRKEIQAFVAERLRRGTEDTERQGVIGGALAGAGGTRQEVPRSTGFNNRRSEENMRRSESAVAEPQASGSKRRRVESDDEYDPRTEMSSEEGSPACWNCRSRGITCERTR